MASVPSNAVSWREWRQQMFGFLTLEITEKVMRECWPGIGPIEYEHAVIIGKQIIKEMEVNQMLLGAMADRLEPRYGGATLARFAAEIGVKAGKVERWRSVYRRWKGKTNPATQPDSQKSAFESQSPSVLKILQGHPNAEVAESIVWGPRLTARQAQTHIDDYRLAHPDQEPAPAPAEAEESAPPPAPAESWEVIEARRWFAQVTKHALAIAAYGDPSPEYLDPDTQCQAVGEDLEQTIATFRKCAEVAQAWADAMEQALARRPPPPPMFH